MKVGDKVRVRSGAKSLYSQWFAYDHGGTEGVITSIGKSRQGCDCEVRFTTGEHVKREWSWPFSCLELLSPSQEDFVSVQPEELDTSIKVGDWVEMVGGNYYYFTENGARGVVTEVRHDEINVEWKSGLAHNPKDKTFRVESKRCKKIPAQSVGQPNETVSASATVEQTKEQKHMVFRVTAILTPSVIAQQNGAVETVLIDNEAVVANDAGAAALVAGAKNADIVKKNSLK